MTTLRLIGIVTLMFIGVFPCHHLNALTISPARAELSTDPGQSITDTIELWNDEDSERTYFISSQNFTADGETGAPNFIGSADGLATWIETNKSVTVLPGERKLVGYTIKVPKTARPGGHFAAIFFSSSDPGTGGQMMIGGRVGALVLLTVSGEVSENAGVNGFMTEGGSLFSNIPIKFSYWFNNMGGNRIKPVGTITIENMFGFEVASFSANPKSGNVLPGSMRKFVAQWGADHTNVGADFFSRLKNDVVWGLRNFHLGYYTANMHLSYGDNKESDVSYTFFIFPWRLVFLLPGLVLLFLVARITLTRYNRWVIAHSHDK